jgi:hypothetical protein
MYQTFQHSDTMPNTNTANDEDFILVHSFRGFSSHTDLASSDSVPRAWQSIVVAKACGRDYSHHGRQGAEKNKKELGSRPNQQSHSPADFFLCFLDSTTSRKFATSWGPIV